MMLLAMGVYIWADTEGKRIDEEKWLNDRAKDYDKELDAKGGKE
jgi:hypothetical protein